MFEVDYPREGFAVLIPPGKPTAHCGYTEICKTVSGLFSNVPQPAVADGGGEKREVTAQRTRERKQEAQEFEEENNGAHEDRQITPDNAVRYKEYVIMPSVAMQECVGARARVSVACEEAKFHLRSFVPSWEQDESFETVLSRADRTAGGPRVFRNEVSNSFFLNPTWKIDVDSSRKAVLFAHSLVSDLSEDVDAHIYLIRNNANGLWSKIDKENHTVLAESGGKDHASICFNCGDELVDKDADSRNSYFIVVALGRTKVDAHCLLNVKTSRQFEWKSIDHGEKKRRYYF